MAELGFQLYSVDQIDEPLPKVIKRVGESEFDGVEFAGLGDASTQELADAVDAADISVVGAHVGIDRIESEFEATIETHRALGCENLVIPYLGPDCFANHQAITETAERLDALADRVASYDMRLHYHNHDHEFTELQDGTPGFEALINATDAVKYEIDLGWVGVAGYDPLELFERHASAVELLHLTDFLAEAGDGAEIGDGDLNLNECIETAHQANIDWAIYEFEDRQGSYETLDVGENRLSPLFE